MDPSYSPVYEQGAMWPCEVEYSKLLQHLIHDDKPYDTAQHHREAKPGNTLRLQRFSKLPILTKRILCAK